MGLEDDLRYTDACSRLSWSSVFSLTDFRAAQRERLFAGAYIMSHIRSNTNTATFICSPHTYSMTIKDNIQAKTHSRSTHRVPFLLIYMSLGQLIFSSLLKPGTIAFMFITAQKLCLYKGRCKCWSSSSSPSLSSSSSSNNNLEQHWIIESPSGKKGYSAVSCQQHHQSLSHLILKDKKNNTAWMCLHWDKARAACARDRHPKHTSFSEAISSYLLKGQSGDAENCFFFFPDSIQKKKEKKTNAQSRTTCEEWMEHTQNIIFSSRL